MNRIQPVPEEDGHPTFAQARQRFGWLPNTVRVMARGSHAAEQYLRAGELNSQSTVAPLARELIAVVVATGNGCEYCRTAHEIAARALRDSSPPDPLVSAQVAFGTRVHEAQGRLDDDELDQARAAGLNDQMMIDIAAVVAENYLGNIINNLARTELDPLLKRHARHSPGQGVSRQ